MCYKLFLLACPRGYLSLGRASWCVLQPWLQTAVISGQAALLPICRRSLQGPHAIRLCWIASSSTCTSVCLARMQSNIYCLACINLPGPSRCAEERVRCEACAGAVVFISDHAECAQFHTRDNVIALPAPANRHLIAVCKHVSGCLHKLQILGGEQQKSAACFAL